MEACAKAEGAAPAPGCLNRLKQHQVKFSCARSRRSDAGGMGNNHFLSSDIYTTSPEVDSQEQQLGQALRLRAAARPIQGDCNGVGFYAYNKDHPSSEALTHG